MASLNHMFNINTDGSKLTYLTSGTKPGKIKFVDIAGASSAHIKSAAQIAAGGKGGNITGIVIPLGGANTAIEKDTAHGWGGATWDPNTANIIGDPGERNYQLTSGDFFTSKGVEKHGGAQKLVLGVLDAAYVAYNSGVAQGSGLSSMTVTRGDLTLNSSTVTGISGIVNTYSRNYSVNFQYKQSGMIELPDGVAALPDVANDMVAQEGDGPF
jgi:hypothetical protein